MQPIIVSWKAIPKIKCRVIGPGTLEACQKEFLSRHPGKDPQVSYFAEDIKYLYIPEDGENANGPRKN